MQEATNGDVAGKGKALADKMAGVAGRMAEAASARIGAVRGAARTQPLRIAQAERGREAALLQQIEALAMQLQAALVRV